MYRKERWFTETDNNHFKSGALRTIKNIVEKEYTLYGKLKKKKTILSLAYLFIDTEHHSKM